MAERADKGYVFVVVGVTGLVGRELLRILLERNFPIVSLERSPHLNRWKKHRVWRSAHSNSGAQ